MNKYKWINKDLTVLNKETKMVISLNNNTNEANEFNDYILNGGLVDDKYSIIELYDKKYNEVTNKTAEIVNGNGFIYKGVNFYTDATAQQNFTALLIMKDSLPYPYQIWDGNDVVDIIDSNELQTFCVLVFNYIATKRKEGKDIRESLQQIIGESDEDYKIRLESFIDPR